MARFELDSAYLSRIGGRSRNEDACGYWTSAAGCCWVISDGAGGHSGGDIASRLVVKTILDRFSANPAVCVEAAVELMQTAHDLVLQTKEDDPRSGDMHATCAVLMINRETGQAVWGHAGDSRLYLFRRGQLVFQTRDHSLVQSMIDAGYGSTEMLRTHPQRSLLTSAIGNTGELLISASEEVVMLEDGDTFLLCSDGWWEYVDEARMQTLLSGTGRVSAWLEDMAQVVEASPVKERDNYTALAIRASMSAEEMTVLLAEPRIIPEA